jgi:hypothetical protein
VKTRVIPQGGRTPKSKTPPAKSSRTAKDARPSQTRPQRIRAPRKKRHGRVRRIVSAPTVRFFAPLLLIAIAALYISWSVSVKFTYMSMGFSTGLVVLATTWTFIYVFLPGVIAIILRNPIASSIVVAALILGLSLCMLAG